MEKKICFVISPIGQDGSETRKRADQILKGIIKPTAIECGYIAKRADEIAKPGLITTQIIQHIIDAPMVIADLTENNANVFYELAIRHAIKKPVVHIIDKKEIPPFDVAAMRVIQINTEDLVSVADAREEIKRQIKAAESPGFVVETPISIAVELKSLRTSDIPLDQQLANLHESNQLQTSKLMEEFKKGFQKVASELELGRQDVQLYLSKDRNLKAEMMKEFLTEIQDVMHRQLHYFFQEFTSLTRPLPEVQQVPTQKAGK